MKILIVLLLECAVFSSASFYSFQSEYLYAYSLINTPITHLIVIVQENVAFDHYFGTYPNAMNKGNDSKFFANTDTHLINGLSLSLSNNNPNNYNGEIANPFVLVPHNLGHAMFPMHMLLNKMKQMED